MKAKEFFVALFFAVFASNAPTNALAQAVETQPTTVESSRRDVEGKYVRIGVTIDSAPTLENAEKLPPKTVFLILPTVETPVARSQLGAPQTLPHEPRHFPMFRNRAALLQVNVTLAWMG